MKKILAILFFFILLLGVGGYFYVYQDHRDIGATKAMKSFTTDELLAIFQDADIENDKKVLDQVIEVSGVATAKDATTLTLDQKVFIQLENPTKLALNQSYTIKGLCLGYDDLLEEIKIDQASIIQTP